MPIFQFNKLVRDKLPQLYVDLRQRITSRKLTGHELLIALRRKLIEEASEVPFEAGTREEIINELSDVEQVIKDIKSETNITDEEVEAARQRKFNEKGGFSNGTFVEQIELRNDDEWVEYYRAEPAKYPELNRAKDEVDLPTIEKGKYLHTKSGHFYEVLGVSLQTETNEALVVYRPLWNAKYELFTRPYDMFIEMIEIEGEWKPRFEKV
jgi:predicted house-cleaning noncanonical NTP pyrophosphatase (MazG superfamily)